MIGNAVDVVVLDIVRLLWIRKSCGKKTNGNQNDIKGKCWDRKRKSIDKNEKARNILMCDCYRRNCYRHQRQDSSNCQNAVTLAYFSALNKWMVDYFFRNSKYCCTLENSHKYGRNVSKIENMTIKEQEYNVEKVTQLLLLETTFVKYFDMSIKSH